MVERGNKGSFLYITLSVYAKILFFRKIPLPHTHNLDCTLKVLCETFWGVQFCFNV